MITRWPLLCQKPSSSPSTSKIPSRVLILSFSPSLSHTHHDFTTHQDFDKAVAFFFLSDGKFNMLYIFTYRKSNLNCFWVLNVLCKTAYSCGRSLPSKKFYTLYWSRNLQTRMLLYSFPVENTDSSMLHHELLINHPGLVGKMDSFLPVVQQTSDKIKGKPWTTSSCPFRWGVGNSFFQQAT